jgi:cell shape-determining protein MreC
MDWELYERQRATLMFIGVAFLSFFLLAFQRSSAVQHIKSFFVRCTLPTQRMFTQITTPTPIEKPVVAPAPVSDEDTAIPSPTGGEVDPHAEHVRAIKVLKEQNTRLSNLLELKRSRWPRLVAAHVVGRDPQHWFQEALLDKGAEEQVQIDDPVIAFNGNREALVGRIVETGAHTSRVMLIHDSLSSVAATVEGATSEDGVVEGSNSHDLYLRFLSRDSHVKNGDPVLTSGLGGTFPEGIPIGLIEDVGLDARQLFLQARLRPAMLSTPLRLVGVLTKREAHLEP